ncbi:MAG: PstS family phosphate ABC transporter substrate-binding protein [Planctomycetales bacterium]
MRWICGARGVAAFCWSLACCGLACCGASGCGASGVGEVNVDGSSTVFPITEAVAEEFQKEAPRIRVTVGVSGTGGGFKKMIAGEIDLCDASRGIKDVERDACAELGVEFVELTVAFDGLTVVVHAENDWVDSMTVEQLRELWRSESAIKKWSDLNPEWPSEEIRLYGPGTDSGTFDYFTKAICGEEGASRADYTRSEDDNILVRGISADRHALGYFGFAYYVQNKDKLKVLGIDGGDGPVKPSVETVGDGTYRPLSRSLFVYLAKPSLKRPAVSQFVAFYLDHVQALSREVGYIALPDDVLDQQRTLFQAAAFPDAAARSSAVPAGGSDSE